jgi:hypothetical protein|tara:strand:- start:622 stop:1395 length:774 start_codon:yes stop_codon:yes gene_type:complete
MANQMNSALKSLQKIHNQLNNRGSLSPEMLKKNKIEKLRNEMINAKNRMHNSPNEYNRAEKAYYLESKGSDYYSTIQRDKYKKEANTQVNSWNKELLNSMFDSIKNSINYYNSQNYYVGNVDEVYKSYDTDLSDLTRKIYDTEQTKNINERLGQFYYNNTETVDWWTYYLKILYYGLIIVSLFIFIFKRQFRQIKMYIFFATILIMPYILDKYYAFIMGIFKHIKLDNIYFIFIVTMLSVIGILNFTSKLPFNTAYV